MKRNTFLLIICVVLLMCPYVVSEEENYIIAQPGDSGVDVELVIKKCSDFGFIKELPEGTDEYIDEYKDSITEMEHSLGFDEDGIIRLDEFEEIETAINEGSEGEQVKNILEQLFELGYIRSVLPYPHIVFEKKYINDVKKAEKKLGLIADGILTKSEQQIIMDQPLPPLAKVTSVSARHNNGKVTVSWGKVKGAVSYAIFRNSILVDRVREKTSWVDENVEMDETYRYSVQAESYLQKGSTSKVVSVEVPITYTSVTIRDLNDTKYHNSYVKLGSMKFVSGSVSGSDMKIEVSKIIDRTTYYATLILDDYKDWTGDVPRLTSMFYKIKTISCRGWVESCGRHPVIHLSYITYNW